MCGFSHSPRNILEDSLSETYQIYPLNKPIIFFLTNIEEINIDPITLLFPDHLEAYCILAFVLMAQDNKEWVGATYNYLDRLAIGYLRREHNKVAKKRLMRWIFSLGQENDMTRSDVFVLLTHNFINLFWGSMKTLVKKGYVHVEQREIDLFYVDVFFPTSRLINMFKQ